MFNPILETDSYKLSHWKMYPKIDYLTSYFEARSGGEFPYIVFFGMAYHLNRYLSGVRITRKHIEEADEFCRAHFGRNDVFNREGWEYILNKYDGALPLLIRAVPEGTVVPASNVLFTVENTDPNVPWLVNHFETSLVRLWYSCSVATSSWYLNQLIGNGLGQSADTMDKLPFMLHDFGARGSTTGEAAALGGAAHLLSFMGTDTIESISLIREHYEYNEGHGMYGYSVPAAEHSTITSWGRSREVEAYRHILQQYNSGLVSVVSDSWDIMNACKNIWGGELASEVRQGEHTGRVLVVRPDSGEPNKVVPQCLNILGEQFGYSMNTKGYRVLPDYIRLIQGDGITRHSLGGIIQSIMESGWSLDNVVFGSGGGLLQNFNRDTCSFAMKCSAVKSQGDENWRGVYKSPVGDTGKNSKQGYLYLNSALETVSYPIDDDVLRPVFYNGDVLVAEDFNEIRRHLANF